MQVELRIRNTDLANVLRSYADRRLRFALSRYGDRVGRVVVTVSEFNETGLGIAKSCHIDAEVRPFSQVAARVTDPDLYMAIDRAAGRLGRLFASRLGQEEDGAPRPAARGVRAKEAKREKKLSSKGPRRSPRKRLTKRGSQKSVGKQWMRIGSREFTRHKAAHPRRKRCESS
jgi:putative sigma-54 modulation protein